MNQYKPIFLGQVDPKSPMAKWTRACNSQKCIRAGGKHNDLEDVGKDVYHHTFFEMLGNWSFGDYFKEEAIDWAWELLTKVYGIDPSRLYVTYFCGSEKDGVPADDEARKMWLKHLPEARILPFDAKDNFWEMGATGPCGPCSEIHYDRIGGRDAASLVNMDDPDVLEIWNLVFMQFNRKSSGALEALPACHVDTGMGFERITSVLQDKRSNYDTDVFAPLFVAIKDMAGTGVPEYAGKVGKEDEGNVDMAYRVIADHIRTLTFAITDGAVPSNASRGDVLRRGLRRMVRYARDILLIEGSLASLVPILIDHMKDAFPELVEKQALVQEVIRKEEKTFDRTLKSGLQYFGKVADKAKAAGSNTISGEATFHLFASMGYPVDLTQLMAEERGMDVDMEGFNAALAQHREISKAGNAAGAANPLLAMKLEAKETDALEKMGVCATVDGAKYTWHEDVSNSVVKAIFNGNEFVQKASPGTVVGVILDKSNFYAEAGGQVCDFGDLKSSDGVALPVRNCQSYKGFVLHVGEAAAEFAVGDSFTCCVDYERRTLLANNHTSTHILNLALRKTIGDKTDQRDPG